MIHEMSVLNLNINDNGLRRKHGKQDMINSNVNYTSVIDSINLVI